MRRGWSLRVANTLSRTIRACACLVAGLTVAACNTGPGRDLTSTEPYAMMVGARYEVVGELYAYGVYKDMDERPRVTIGYLDLVPTGIGGIEIGFKRQVPIGQVIRILSAWQRFPLLKSSIYYNVEFENADPAVLPEGIPAELLLDRGNEGVGPHLNSAVYRRLPDIN
jgi:predicted small secreted protein